MLHEMHLLRCSSFKHFVTYFGEKKQQHINHEANFLRTFKSLGEKNGQKKRRLASTRDREMHTLLMRQTRTDRRERGARRSRDKSVQSERRAPSPPPPS